MLLGCQKPSVETSPIRQDVIETVFASGILEAANSYDLTAENDGYLVGVNFEEGDVVKKGQVLARIQNLENALNAENAEILYQNSVKNARTNAPTLLQARTAVENARQKMEQDRLQAERYERLLAKNSVARSDYEIVILNFRTSQNNYEGAIQAVKKLEEETQQQTVSPKNQQEIKALALENNAIRAVERGKTYKKSKQTGDFVRRGDVIARIGDPDFIYAKVNVDEGSIGKVKVGQKAFVRINAQKSKVYNAVVYQILPAFDEAQQSFVCKLKFEDILDFSIINAQLQTNITLDTQKNALLIPRHFLEYGGFVFVKNGSEEPQKVKVETQFVSSDWVQILSGIDEKSVLFTTNVPGVLQPSGNMPGAAQ